VTIDVTVATKNSARTLNRCLSAINANIPVHQLIVVDGNSTDGSTELAKRRGASVVAEGGLLGRVRYVQALSCQTEWVAYVDSDVYIYESWWPHVSRYLNTPNVGMILGEADAPIAKLPIYEKYLKHITRKFGAAAFSNALIRRELVLSCKELLDDIHAGEDTILARHLRGLGMRIVTLSTPLFYHDKTAVDDHPKAFFRWGQSSRIVGGRAGLKNLAKTLKNNIRNWWIFTTETGQVNMQLLAFLLYLWWQMLLGYLHP
jgi:glycosyltransferase involved in cell wall biosynthesis